LLKLYRAFWNAKFAFANLFFRLRHPDLAFAKAGTGLPNPESGFAHPDSALQNAAGSFANPGVSFRNLFSMFGWTKFHQPGAAGVARIAADAVTKRKERR
jgi:hypothetical protein